MTPDPAASSNATADAVKRPHGAVITLLAIAFLVLSPVLIPTGMVLAAFSNRRLRAIADTFRCVQCNNALGPRAVEWADQGHREHLGDLLRKFPGARFRVVQTCHAICTACRTRYRYLEKEGTFVLEDGDSQKQET